MIKKLSPYLSPAFKFKWHSIITFVINLFIIIVESVMIIFLWILISNIETWNIEFMKTFIIFALIMYLSLLIMIIVSHSNMFLLRQKSIEEVSKIYADKFIKLDSSTVDKIWTSKFISTYSTWINAFWMIWTRIIWWMTRNVWRLIFSTIFIIIEVWIYSIGFVLSLFILVYISHKINQINIKKKWEYRKYQNEDFAKFIKMFNSKFEILQHDKFKKEAELMEKNFIDTRKKWIEYFKYDMLTFWSPITIVTLSQIIFMWAGAYYVIKWNLDMASYTVVCSALFVIRGVITNFASLFSEIWSFMADIDKLNELFDSVPNIKGYEEWKDFKIWSWRIALENISYSYWEKIVFDNLNLEIKPGSKIALVWRSWAWKTTIAKLISGYIRPDSWVVLVDGQNLEEVSLKSFYKQIWYLTQEPGILDDTIRTNLVYWLNSTPSEKELHNVIEKAWCDFIFNYEAGLDTVVWDRWILLSWWQRQRLAIAKLMLKNPEIIILDEPTSALDSFSEDLITSSLSKLFKWKTIIVIAHRLQTVRDSDEIIVMHSWRISERWSHDELLELDWEYASMYKLQTWFEK